MPIQPNFLEQFIPGLTANTATASGNIGTQLSGLPSTSNARRKAAYFGAASGMPNSGVSNALGYDLYGQEAEAQKQQGFDNLIKMLTGYSGTAAPTTGQVLNEQQWNSDQIYDQQDQARAVNAAQSKLSSMRKPSTTVSRGGGIFGGTSDTSIPWWQRR